MEFIIKESTIFGVATFTNKATPLSVISGGRRTLHLAEETFTPLPC